LKEYITSGEGKVWRLLFAAGYKEEADKLELSENELVLIKNFVDGLNEENCIEVVIRLTEVLTKINERVYNLLDMKKIKFTEDDLREKPFDNLYEVMRGLTNEIVYVIKVLDSVRRLNLRSVIMEAIKEVVKNLTDYFKVVKIVEKKIGG
jgi:hypothetical protein